MSEEAKQLRHNAVIIDGYARGLLDQARTMQQKAAELEELTNRHIAILILNEGI